MAKKCLPAVRILREIPDQAKAAVGLRHKIGCSDRAFVKQMVSHEGPHKTAPGPI